MQIPAAQELPTFSVDVQTLHCSRPTPAALRAEQLRMLRQSQQGCREQGATLPTPLPAVSLAGASTLTPCIKCVSAALTFLPVLHF